MESSYDKGAYEPWSIEATMYLLVVLGVECKGLLIKLVEAWLPIK